MILRLRFPVRSANAPVGISDSFEQMGVREEDAPPFRFWGRLFDLITFLRCIGPDGRSTARPFLPTFRRRRGTWVYRLLSISRYTPFPPLPLTIVRRGSFFWTGRTFGAYVRRVEKAYTLLGLGVERRTPAVLAVMDGMANAPSRRIRVVNILRFADCRRFTEHESTQSEFGRVGFMSYLFLLRLPSGIYRFPALTRRIRFALLLL